MAETGLPPCLDSAGRKEKEDVDKAAQCLELQTLRWHTSHPLAFYQGDPDHINCKEEWERQTLAPQLGIQGKRESSLRR